MILAPFRLIVSLLFQASYAVFLDPGWAVVGMSVLLSLLLTPLYVWIEHRKNANRVSEAPMQAEIDKLEAVYTGRERFFYTREIHRRYGYKPLTALIPVLGLLVQIPFLLAAYHYLAELPIFSGAPFLYIHDLSRPDTIARVAGIPVNLLAILMTLINLVSGWRYADPRKPKERIQYIAVALIFFILLYRCAAAVVLYWTLSQALSLVRSEVFFRKQKAPDDLAPTSIWLFAPWLPAFGRTVLLSLLAFAVVLFLDALALGDIADLSVFHRAMALSNAASGILLAAELLCIALVWRRTAFDPALLPVGFRLVLLANLAVALLAVLLRWGGLPVGDSVHLAYVRDMSFPLLAVGAALALAIGGLCAFFPKQPDTANAWQPPAEAWWLVLPATCIPAQIALCSPVCVLATFPAGAYGVSAWKLVGCGILCTLATALVAWGLWRALPKGGRKFILFPVWFAFLCAFCYGNLVSADYGVLFHGIFSKPEGLSPQTNTLFREAAILIAGGAALAWLLPRMVWRAGAVKWVLSILLTSFFIRTAIALPKIKVESDTHSTRLADEPLFRFSRSGTNTVFVLLDCFVGRQLGLILDRRPDLKAELDGFVWYPNTISAGPVTYPNIPSIIGGMEYTPYKVARSGLTMGQVFDQSFDTYQRTVHNKGYRFVCTDIFRRFYNISTNGIDSIFNESNPAWNAYGRKEHGLISDATERSLDQIALRGNALLRAVPLVLRSAVYDNGSWNANIPDASAFAPFSFLDALPRISEVADEPSGLYAHIHNESTHYPSWIPIRGKLVDGDPNDCFEWALERVVEWMRWMKHQGVYDNTRIVLCSDHGTHVPNFDPTIVNMGNIWKVAQWGINYFPLLMVKDAAAHAPFCRDNAFKTVSHGAYFALESPKFNEPVTEYVPSMVNTVVPTGWRHWTHYDTTFSFRIVNDPSDGANWSRIED